MKRRHEIRDWTATEITTLRALWAEGLSTAAIGLRIGRTKNQVIGKAHRLHLPSRANPVKRTYEKKPKEAMKVIPIPRPSLLPVVFRARVAPREALPSRSPSSHRECQWTDNDRSPWTFCCAPTIRGFSWCAKHKARVFRGVGEVAA